MRLAHLACCSLVLILVPNPHPYSPFPPPPGNSISANRFRISTNAAFRLPAADSTPFVLTTTSAGAAAAADGGA